MTTAAPVPPAEPGDAWARAPSRPVAEPPASLVGKLVAEGAPFVRATVVRTEAPAPARAGDRAVVLADGTIAGFVGGQCVETSVRAAALDVLDTGSALLLRVLPPGGNEYPDAPGARVVVNHCISGGALEIFLEPRLPPPVVAIAGDTPIADAVARLAESLGFAVMTAPSLAGRPPYAAGAVVVASHGHEEPESIRAALDAGVPLVGLVASRRRGEAVLDGMGLSAGERARVRTPAGLDIGARTPAEIGLSIMAQVVQALRSARRAGVEGEGASVGGSGGGDRAPGAVPGTGADRPASTWPGSARAGQAVDPVCGMTVAVGPRTPHRVVDGCDVWFCSRGCRDAYVA